MVASIAKGMGHEPLLSEHRYAPADPSFAAQGTTIVSGDFGCVAVRADPRYERVTSPVGVQLQSFFEDRQQQTQLTSFGAVRIDDTPPSFGHTLTISAIEDAGIVQQVLSRLENSDSILGTPFASHDMGSGGIRPMSMDQFLTLASKEHPAPPGSPVIVMSTSGRKPSSRSQRTTMLRAQEVARLARRVMQETCVYPGVVVDHDPRGLPEALSLPGWGQGESSRPHHR